MPGSFNINQNYSDFKIVPIFPQAPSFAFVRLVMTAVLSDPDSTKLMAASILGSFVNDLNLFYAKSICPGTGIDHGITDPGTPSFLRDFHAGQI